MAGRGRGRGNDGLLAQMTATLQNINENLQNLNQNNNQNPNQNPIQPQGPAEYRGLDEFCKRNPSQFQGGFAPDAANDWIQELEKIFRAMGCTDAQKVTYAAYMLVKEAKNWWTYTRRQMEAEQQAVTWEAFKGKFLQKYFPADLKKKKELEFLRLKQGNMSVGEYTAKFDELAKYFPYYDLDADGRSKCAKFEVGLKPELKMMFGHQEISDFPTLVNKCRMFEDDMKARDVALRSAIPQKNFGPQRNHMHGMGKGKMFSNKKPYTPPVGYKGPSSQGFKPAAGRQLVNSPPLCNNCGRNYFGPICPGPGNACFFCKVTGHIRINCPKMKQSMNAGTAARPKATGIVLL